MQQPVFNRETATWKITRGKNIPNFGEQKLEELYRLLCLLPSFGTLETDLILL